MAVVDNVFSPEQLKCIQKTNTDADDVKERKFFLLDVLELMVTASIQRSSTERELHRSRWWWAYKWLNRFDKQGLEGLKDQPRSGAVGIIQI